MTTCFLFLQLLFTALSSKSEPAQQVLLQSTADTVLIKGDFEDDYGIRYTINDSQWIQYPRVIYHIVKWDKEAGYIIAKNDAANPGYAGLYTRIDYMRFTDMEPWQWGFCLTNYNAADSKAAEASIAADRLHPKKGCGGFPFSRMKRMPATAVLKSQQD
jgi:hypothetical protein